MFKLRHAVNLEKWFSCKIWFLQFLVISYWHSVKGFALSMGYLANEEKICNTTDSENSYTTI